jgi:putative peptidoglycan lipid II flippase
MLGAALLALLGIAFAPTLASLVGPGFDADTRRLTIILLRLLFPMAGLMVVSAWCLGILNTHGRFFLPYAAPAVWNVAAIAVLVGAATWFVSPGLALHAQL